MAQQYFYYKYNHSTFNFFSRRTCTEHLRILHANLSDASDYLYEWFGVTLVCIFGTLVAKTLLKVYLITIVFGKISLVKDFSTFIFVSVYLLVLTFASQQLVDSVSIIRNTYTSIKKYIVEKAKKSFLSLCQIVERASNIRLSTQLTHAQNNDLAKKKKTFFKNFSSPKSQSRPKFALYSNRSLKIIFSYFQNKKIGSITKNTSSLGLSSTFQFQVTILTRLILQ